jgi:hypothetical protein
MFSKITTANFSRDNAAFHSRGEKLSAASRSVATHSKLTSLQSWILSTLLSLHPQIKKNHTWRLWKANANLVLIRMERSVI